MMLGLHLHELDLPDPWQIGDDLDLLDAELIGEDFGDNMVAAFHAQAPPAPPAQGGLLDGLTAAYDAARGYFFPKPEAPAPSPVPGAIAAGNRDENALTDLAFNARHPERGGAKIQPGDKDLAKEWTQLRDTVVRPALARAGGGAPHPAASPAASLASSPVSAPPSGSNAAVAAQVAADTKRKQQIGLALGALAVLGIGTALITR